MSVDRWQEAVTRSGLELPLQEVRAAIVYRLSTIRQTDVIEPSLYNRELHISRKVIQPERHDVSMFYNAERFLSQFGLYTSFVRPLRPYVMIQKLLTFVSSHTTATGGQTKCKDNAH